MRTFLAYEFQNDDTLKETGVVEVYHANSAKEAAQSLLYTKRLKNKNAKLGPTETCVYVGDKCYSVVPEKRRLFRAK